MVGVRVEDTWGLLPSAGLVSRSKGAGHRRLGHTGLGRWRPAGEPTCWTEKAPPCPWDGEPGFLFLPRWPWLNHLPFLDLGLSLQNGMTPVGLVSCGGWPGGRPVHREAPCVRGALLTLGYHCRPHSVQWPRLTPGSRFPSPRPGIPAGRLAGRPHRDRQAPGRCQLGMPASEPQAWRLPACSLRLTVINAQKKTELPGSCQASGHKGLSGERVRAPEGHMESECLLQTGFLRDPGLRVEE